MARSKQKRQRSRGKAENNTPKKTDEEDRAGGDPRGDEEDRMEEEDDTHISQQNADDEELDASKEVRTRRQAAVGFVWPPPEPVMSRLLGMQGDEADTVPKAFGKGGGATAAEGEAASAAVEEQDESLSTFENRCVLHHIEVANY